MDKKLFYIKVHVNCEKANYLRGLSYIVSMPFPSDEFVTI